MSCHLKPLRPALFKALYQPVLDALLIFLPPYVKTYDPVFSMDPNNSIHFLFKGTQTKAWLEKALGKFLSK